MKLSELLTKLEAIEGAKSLVVTFRAEIGDLPDMDLKEYGARIKKADSDAATLADLTKTVGELDGKVKEVEPLKAKVTAYEKTLSDGLLLTSFTEKALAAGVNKEAVPAAFKLAKLETAKVDLDKKAVSGITADVFTALKTEHSFLFAPAAKQAVVPPPTLSNTTPPSPLGAKASAMEHFERAQQLREAAQP